MKGTMTAHRSRLLMSPKLHRIAELAREKPERQFFSIAHFLTPEALSVAFHGLRRAASAGIDGVTYADYERDEERNIQELHGRLNRQQYRAQPLRRVYVPKETGEQRPISIPCIEDKIVQKAAATLLEAIYEEDFLECSFGFRPGRGPHNALDRVGEVICRRPVSTVLEADISAYFDSIVREHLMGMIEKRIRDSSILRLLRKWMNVGVIDQGRLLVTQTGTGQGQIISPLLANVYLHYVLDEWFEEQVRPRLRGEAHLIRYCDDFIMCFQHREDAERTLQVLHKRFERYGLSLHPRKTRLLDFGRHAAARAKARGEKKPDTFDFLGFTHVATTSRKGRFTIHVRTMRTRIRRSLVAISQWCQAHRHDPVGTQQQALTAKCQGHYQYYGRPTNYRRLWGFYRAVRRIWKKWLNRRTRGKTMGWERYAELLSRHPLPRPKITHAWAGAVSHA